MPIPEPLITLATTMTVLLLLSLLSLLTVPDDAGWPCFLNNAIVEIPDASIPVTWSDTDNIAWQTDLPGHGQSSPVVIGSQAYVTSVQGPMKDTYILTAVDVASGRVNWQREFPNSAPVKSSTFVSRAAPTPVADRDGVVAFFESGDIVAVSVTGEVRWQKCLSKEYGTFENEYGLGASLVQSEDAIFVLVDHQGPSYVIALAKNDGRVLWKTDRTSRASWASPRICRIGDSLQLLCSSAGTIDGYDLNTGKQLWTHEGVGGNRICTPWILEDGSFLIGSHTSREFPDQDSVRKSNFLMTVRQQDGNFIPEITWRTEEASPGMASPMAWRGMAYWINRTGVLFAFDVASGEKRYAERIAQSCWATPVGIGDHVFCFGKDGVTTVIKAGEKFEVVAQNQLWDPETVEKDNSLAEQETDPVRIRGAQMHAAPEVYAAIAVPGSWLIRTGHRLYCIRQAATANTQQ